MKALILVLAAMSITGVSYARKTPPPLRMAKVRGSITKLTATLDPIHVKDEKVCDVDGEVPVYQSGQPYASMVNFPDCDTTIQGRPVKVYLSSSMSVGSPTKMGLTKTAVAILSFKDPLLGDHSPNFLASAGSPDSKTQKLGLSLGSSSFESGQHPVVHESFSFGLLFDDLNQ